MSTIRLAEETDAPAVQAIYAPYVRNTVISFELEPPSVDEMAARIHKTLPQFPWLIYVNEGGEVSGYAYASRHRDRAAYQWSVDVTVYLPSSAHRRGIGRALYTSLLALLQLQGFYNAYAGVTQPNVSSVGLHLAMGFEPIGIYQHVGYKYGKWHDVAWYGLVLNDLVGVPALPQSVTDILPMEAGQMALNAGLTVLGR